ncbi:MAG TPA: oligopeptide:H+ symporter [Candidatus Limnocylindrales bacterium]|nr:oligopeptide:H+ symporter [Candidatus Limnocylindrales bacterium]
MPAENQAVSEPLIHASTTRDRWPRQIKYIVGNEACERFSYYGMRSILAGYITVGLGQSVDKSTSVIHMFIFANYFMPLFGAWLSDKLIGRYHTILWVSLFYCAGHGVLACSDLLTTVDGKLYCLYAGLALIAFGSGGIKPCVSAFMGDQFRADQSHLLQKAYGAFYWSINFGSFFAFLLIPLIRKHHGYGWAFAAPGFAMGLATLVFWLGTKHYVRVPPSRETKTAGFMPVFLSAYRNQAGFSWAATLNMLAAVVLPLIAILSLAIVGFAQKMTPFMHTLGIAGLVVVGLWYFLIVATSLAGKFELPESFWQAARQKFRDHEIAGARTVGPILFVFALIPIFWALFDQTNSTWVLQGSKMLSFKVLGFVVGAEEMQSANALLVLILVPLLTLVVYPRIGRFSTPLKRISVGLFLTAASYVIVALIQQQVEAGAQISVAWQVVPYIVLTTAEVLVSTTGLEFAFTQAAPEMKSTVMSFWLLTVAFGSLVVTAITKVLSTAASGHSDSVSTGRFYLYAGLTFAVAILFSAVAFRYQYAKGTVGGESLKR